MHLSTVHVSYKKFRFAAFAFVVVGLGIASGLALTVNVSEANAAAKCINKTFKQGSKDTCIKYMQQIVNASHITSHVPVDGVFGPSAKRAVVKFQKAKKLTADGVIGKGTWDALCKVGGSAADAPQKKAGCRTPYKSGYQVYTKFIHRDFPKKSTLVLSKNQVAWTKAQYDKAQRLSKAYEVKKQQSDERYQLTLAYLERSITYLSFEKQCGTAINGKIEKRELKGTDKYAGGLRPVCVLGNWV